ncbi:MAG: hypothetical protein Q7K57_47030 [Burkholderiaceae bacterium]|nr:hypothetical protein [Burkholderiaceae bacterium]
MIDGILASMQGGKSMRALLRYPTQVGTFYIAQSTDGRFHPVFDDESLGSYRSIAHAINDLTSDATSSALHPKTFELMDTSVLGLPDNPGEWIRV